MIKRLLTILAIVAVLLTGVYYLSSRKKIALAPSLQETLSDTVKTVQTESQKLGILPNSFLLEVSSPQDKLTISQGVIEVVGKSVPGAEVFVNDFQVSVAKDGSFRHKVRLEEGENFILVTAGNNTGDAEIERTVYLELP